MGAFIDLTGKKFGRLTVLERTDDLIQPSGQHKTQWLCKCDCGNLITVQGCNLKSEHTQSCGCYSQDYPSHTKHNKCKTRLYKCWKHIKQRCYDKNSKEYINYGGRGITVCNEWLNDFQVFYDWAMANGYKDDLTIDRIDVNGNYEPSNCRWVTVKVQNNNKRSNRLITYNEKTQTLAQWADELQINYKKLYARIVTFSWNIEKAFNTP